MQSRLTHFFPPVTTDRAGRFRIRGVGRDRIVAFTIEGPAIETKVIHVLTRPGLKAGDVRLEEGAMITPTGIKEGRLKPYYPPEFTHTAAPGRVVSGVVRDRATRQPLVGAVVRGEQPVRYPLSYNQTTTDRKGHFRLTGMPLNPSFGLGASVVALPPAGEPYLALVKRLPRDKETKEATVDFELPPGVWLEGQVKDKATGRGVLAQLRYYSFVNGRPTPGVALASGGTSAYWDPYKDLMTDPDGKFRLVIGRGRGLVGALAPRGNRYRVGVGADKIKGLARDAGDRVFANPLDFSADSFNTLVEITPPKGAKRVRCDILLDPGRALTVQVRGPDGKPLGGTRAQGLWARSPNTWSQGPLSATFTLYGLGPGKGRILLLEHPQKNLVARREVRGNERGPVVVTLRPAARVVGRLVDEDGRPLAHAEITVQFRLTPNAAPCPASRQFRTDAAGKFSIDGMFPGASYHAHVGPPSLYSKVIFDGLSLQAGQTKDLGTVKPKKFDG